MGSLKTLEGFRGGDHSNLLEKKTCVLGGGGGGARESHRSINSFKHGKWLSKLVFRHAA